MPLERTGDARLAALARSGDAAAREMLIRRHGRLVRRLARGFGSSGFSQDDLMQTGYVALILAVERFDPGRGVQFGTYAAALIRGELQHMLRDQGWSIRVPRSLQEIGSAAVRQRELLAQSEGRQPSVADIASSLGLAPGSVRDGLAARGAYRADALGADEDERVGAGDAGYERVERSLDLAAALPRLPVRQREIVLLRFEHDMTQRAIAERLGLSQVHVSRLLRAALATLRGLLEDAPAPPPRAAAPPVSALE